MKLFSLIRRHITPLVVICCFVFFGSQAAHATSCTLVGAASGVPASTDATVLMLGTTLTDNTGSPAGDLCTSLEATQAQALGFNVEIDAAAAWGAKTQAQFATYSAIVLGDADCPNETAGAVLDAPLAAANANKATWQPAVTGSIAVVGTDPEFHFLNDTNPQKTTAAQSTQNAIAFAVSGGPGQTGAYISLSCYYEGSAAGTAVDVLSPQFGAFTVKGRLSVTYSPDTVTIGSPANPLVTTPNALNIVGLSNWGVSVHEAFDSAVPFGFSAVVNSDGLDGLPYILAKTVAPLVQGPRTPTSGAMLTIDGTIGTGTTAVIVNCGTPTVPAPCHIYDSQIHTGTVQTVSVGTVGSNCNANDQLFPTDAYVFQGRSWTGCDQGGAFETGGTNGMATISGAGYSFTITTSYTSGSNTNGTISTGAGGSTGFVTIKNNSGADFSVVGLQTGITLSGTPVNVTASNAAYCSSPGAVASDTITTLANGMSKVLALSIDSSDCGGFNAPQTQPLVANQTTIFRFGKDDYLIRPSNSAPGDMLTLLPIPVPAGPVGSATFGTFTAGFVGPPMIGSGSGFGLGQFGQETPLAPQSSSQFSAPNFPKQACVPFTDFSASARDNNISPAPSLNPVCPEIQLTCSNGESSCSDAGTFLYTAQVDFTVDPIVGNGIGGVHFLGQHNVPCPTTGFNIDVVLSYTGSAPGTDPPIKIGGSGKSCFVTTYDPGVAPVANGTTAKAFDGFFSPVNDAALNQINAGRIVPLKWTLTDGAGGPPVTTLTLCATQDGTGCTAPWVFLTRIPIACPAVAAVNTAIDTALPSNSSGFQANNPVPGAYLFNWQTSKKDTGCVTVEAKFSTGLALTPASFQFVH